MTHCDFSARAARDEMRHITGSSEPDVIIGSEAQVARGRQWQICACSGWLRVTREDQGLSTQVCGRSPTRDVSRCEHASTRSDQRQQRNREGRTNRDMGAPSRWSNEGTVERGPGRAGDA